MEMSIYTVDGGFQSKLGNSTFIIEKNIQIAFSLSNAGLNDLWLLSGDPAETDTMSCDDQWFSYLHLHGLLMATAFGVLLPTGFVIARYFRCSKSKVWFYLHVSIQVGNNYYK